MANRKDNAAKTTKRSNWFLKGKIPQWAATVTRQMERALGTRLGLLLGWKMTRMKSNHGEDPVECVTKVRLRLQTDLGRLEVVAIEFAPPPEPLDSAQLLAWLHAIETGGVRPRVDSHNELMAWLEAEGISHRLPVNDDPSELVAALRAKGCDPRPHRFQREYRLQSAAISLRFKDGREGQEWLKRADCFTDRCPLPEIGSSAGIDRASMQMKFTLEDKAMKTLLGSPHGEGNLDPHSVPPKPKENLC